MEKLPNPPDATPDEPPQTLNPGSSSSSPPLDALGKRTRDHNTQMAEIQLPQNSTAQQPEDQKLPKLPKLNIAQEETEDNNNAEEEGREAIGVPHNPKPKRRKIAILVAYCGVGYQGMQRNPGAKTIEGDLEEALFKAGAISPDHFGNPKMLDWMRSARTDKGVSAVGQVVSGRFFIDPPGFVERVNSHLPHQIRVLGYKRVTPSFSAKKFCDRRRYEYVLPVFALDPTAHRDRESVLASVGLVKCLECSERGRKVVGLMGKKNEFDIEACNAELNQMDAKNENADDFKNESVGSLGGLVAESENGFQMNEKSRTMVVGVNDNGLKGEGLENHGKNENSFEVCEIEKVPKNENTDDLNNKAVGSLGGLVAESVNEFEINEKSRTMVVGVNDNGLKGEGLENHGKNENSFEVCEIEKVPVGQNDDEIGGKCTSFDYGEEERRRFNRVLRKYVGTHNFHNLTTRTKAEDPAANRYILSFEASDVFNIDGMDFVRCTVLGQSFMLHQIRKMIGLAVAVMRGCAPESIIDTALRKDVHMNVPTAPELGLFLDESFFPAYNQKWQATHEEISLKGFEKQILEFKQEYIYKHIASTEVKDGVVALWLHSLNQRNYPDFVAGRQTEKLQSEIESTISVPQESIADKDVLAN